jgi:hypothetical protein
MVLAKIPRDTEVIVKSAGSKVGTGTVHIAIAYNLI